MLHAFPLRAVLVASVLCTAPPVTADQLSDISEEYTAEGVPSGESDSGSRVHGIIGGLGVNYQRVVGDTSGNALLPLVLFTYDDWAYWSMGGGGLWYRPEGSALRLGVGIKFHPGWNADDADLAGMHNRDSTLDGSVGVLWRSSVINVGFNYYHDLRDVYDGSFATLHLSHRFKLSPHFLVTPSVNAQWQSAELVDYQYGVYADEATALWPAYEGRAATNYGAGLSAAWIQKRVAVIGGVHVTTLGQGITDSPIVSRSSARVVYLGAGWMF